MDNSVQLIFSILDSKAGAFGPPFLARSKGEAMRSMDKLVNEPKGSQLVADYPEDFVLYLIGEFDAQLGAILPVGKLESVCKGTDFVRQVPYAPVARGSSD